MNDLRHVAEWPDIHWHIAGFVCACIPVLAAMLVSFGVLSVFTAVCAAVLAIAYILLVTWYYARGGDKKKTEVLK
jgi:hypothetical protein